MKNLDLNCVGIQEMNINELKVIDGGNFIIDGLLFELAKTLFIAGYRSHSKTMEQLGPDAANAGMMFN